MALHERHSCTVQLGGTDQWEHHGRSLANPSRKGRRLRHALPSGEIERLGVVEFLGRVGVATSKREPRELPTSGAISINGRGTRPK